MKCQIWDKNLKRPVGRPKSVRTPETIAAVSASIEQSPTPSPRKHTSSIKISVRTVRRSLHTDLQEHSYKTVIAQELRPADCGRRRDCFNAILTAVSSNAIVWASDEAHFHLTGGSKQKKALKSGSTVKANIWI